MAEGSGAAAGAAASAAATGGEGQQAQAAEAAVQSQPQQTDGQSTESQAEEVQGEQPQEGVQSEEKKTEEGATEEKKPWVSTHKHFDKLKEYYPDRQFTSDDEVESAFDEYLTEHEIYRARGDKANDELNAVLDANPKLLQVLKAMINDAVPFNVAMARHYAPEDFVLQEGDDHFEDAEKNRQAREKELVERRERDKQIKANQQESLKTLEAYMKDEGMTQESKDEMMNKFDTILQEIFDGKITRDTLNAIRRAVEFDAAVKEAAETGEKKGKNQTITAKMSEEDKKKGDGVPALDGGGEIKETKRQPQWIDEIVDGTKARDPFLNTK